jgi:hypothetical protein
MTVSSTIPGVVLGDTFANVILGASDRNTSGKGAIRSEQNGTRFRWRAPGQVLFGPAVDVLADANVILESADPGKYVRARIKTAYVRPEAVEREVYLQDRYSNQFTDINAADALTGITITAIWRVENAGLTSLHNCVVWINAEAPYLSISVDGGATYSSPTAELTGLLVRPGGGIKHGHLLPSFGNFALVRVRRTIPPATAGNPRVLGGLQFSFDGI